MKLKDKVAGVTGSARGLGWEIAHAFAEEGAKVIICDLDQTNVEQAVTRLDVPLDRALGVRADVSVEQDVLLINRCKSTCYPVVAGVVSTYAKESNKDEAG